MCVIEFRIRTTDYILHGDRLAHVTVSDGNNTDNLHFYYDASNRPIALDYNGTKYFYVHNVHNDIVAIVDSAGGFVVQYTYNAWGKLLDTTTDPNIVDSVTLARLNPFRYRGYVYDEETGLYYLRSRYYDPELQRFINPDEIEYLGEEGEINSYNLYCYCLNNPVNRSDETGNWSMPNWLKVTVGVAVIGGLAVATALTGGVAGAIVGAALTGAVTGSAIGAVAGAAIGGHKGGVKGAIDGMCTGFATGAIGGAVVGAAVSGVSYATGAVKVLGSAQKTGTFLHKAASNIEAGKMLLNPVKYNAVTLNRSLNTAGLSGRRIPDVIGVFRRGAGGKLVEVVSKSQTYNQMVEKCKSMCRGNPGSNYSVVTWAARVARWRSRLR